MIRRVTTVIVGFWYLLTYNGENNYAEHCRRGRSR